MVQVVLDKCTPTLAVDLPACKWNNDHPFIVKVEIGYWPIIDQAGNGNAHHSTKLAALHQRLAQVHASYDAVVEQEVLLQLWSTEERQFINSVLAKVHCCLIQKALNAMLIECANLAPTQIDQLQPPLTASSVFDVSFFLQMLAL